MAQLGADLEHVAEAACGDQARRHAAALDQGVGDQGGAVDDVPDLLRGDIVAVQHFPHAPQHGLVRRMRGGENLAVEQASVAGIEHHQVGEGPADVHPDAVGRSHGAHRV